LFEIIGLRTPQQGLQCKNKQWVNGRAICKKLQLEIATADFPFVISAEFLSTQVYL
jgi:hypothetical protein